MTTPTITGTYAGAFSPRTPERLTKKQVTCDTCGHLDRCGALALGDGVGWCEQARQYRHMTLLRTCDSFSENGG